MGLIEQAARRLDELRKAGAEIPAPLDRQGAPEHRPATPSAPAAAEPPPAAPEPAGPVVALDLGRLSSMGFVTPDLPRSRIADEFRIIKRPLIAHASATGEGAIENGNFIMVTSSLPGEGKTFCALNLAMSVAMEMDRSVILVDADVARPSLPRTLNLPGSPGLLDLLQDRTLDVGKLLVRTSVERLAFLPAGNPHPRATEMLASEVMTERLRELRERYPERLVIFDSPPLLVTTESRVLAARMGQIVFVVHAESTLQEDVKRALATIEPCPMKRVVLNKARTHAQGAYAYGYGYGYGK